MADRILFDKKTKIIATLGPATDDPEVVEGLIYAGVDMFRLNVSHRSEPEEIDETVARVKSVAKKLNRDIGIFMDLQGPKIRTGTFVDGKVMVSKGDYITLTTDQVQGTVDRVSVSYPEFVIDIQVDDPLFIDDGKIQLKVVSKSGNDVVCLVEKGGEISNKKGVNLPQTALSISALSEKDKQDVTLAVKHKLAYVALSFVSTETDVYDLRQHLDSLGGGNIQIIAKIERQLAVDNIPSIVEAADLVMVARGDLGVEIGVQNVPRVQKYLIREANRLVKPVIVATQMLESMIHANLATRAEVSDVANAIYDRCDAVMLSGETAIGIDPVNTVEAMRDICIATDDHVISLRKENPAYQDYFIHKSMATSICKAADQIALENQAKAIIAFTSSGTTPLIASKLNSIFPIIAPTDEQYICNRMAVYRGVLPMLLPKKFLEIGLWKDMIRLAVDEAKKLKWVEVGDVLVVTAGIPIGQSNGINSIRVITVQ